MHKPTPLASLAAFHPLVKQLRLARAMAQAFLSLESRYNSTNAYHNSIHAADVLSMVCFIDLKSNCLRTL